MNSNNLTRLEAEIRKALPELMELTEGCEIGYYKYGIITINEFNKVKKNRQVFLAMFDCWLFYDEYDIIGHPVTLLHLLRWLGEIGYGKIDTDFNLSFLGLEPMQWDYTKPLLRDQSQEVIDELCKLIN